MISPPHKGRLLKNGPVLFFFLYSITFPFYRRKVPRVFGHFCVLFGKKQKSGPSFFLKEGPPTPCYGFFIGRVRARLEAAQADILAETRRVDVDRLGIPVYLSVCGADARRVMPTRKQMGKGSSPAQAQASALMELENIRILKEMRNSVNRQVNCETANINKTVSAAVKQLGDIAYIRDTVGLDFLPEALAEIAKLRLEMPDATLKELGENLSAPVGKSGVNHRLRKISTIAESLREERGDP